MAAASSPQIASIPEAIDAHAAHVEYIASVQKPATLAATTRHATGGGCAYCDSLAYGCAQPFVPVSAFASEHVLKVWKGVDDGQKAAVIEAFKGRAFDAPAREAFADADAFKAAQRIFNAEVHAVLAALPRIVRVEVDPAHFADADLVEDVKAELAAHGYTAAQVHVRALAARDVARAVAKRQDGIAKAAAKVERAAARVARAQAKAAKAQAKAAAAAASDKVEGDAEGGAEQASPAGGDADAGEVAPPAADVAVASKAPAKAKENAKAKEPAKEIKATKSKDKEPVARAAPTKTKAPQSKTKAPPPKRRKGVPTPPASDVDDDDEDEDEGSEEDSEDGSSSSEDDGSDAE